MRAHDFRCGKHESSLVEFESSMTHNLAAGLETHEKPVAPANFRPAFMMHTQPRFAQLRRRVWNVPEFFCRIHLFVWLADSGTLRDEGHLAGNSRLVQCLKAEPHGFATSSSAGAVFGIKNQSHILLTEEQAESNFATI